MLRRQSSETTNSLSVSTEFAPSWGSSLAVACGFSRHSGSRASLSLSVRRCVPRASVSLGTLGPLGQPEKAIGHESQREPWLPLNQCSALLVSERQASLRRAMKTARRGTPNCRIRGSGNRAHGAGDQNRSRLISWAAKQEKIQPLELCFFLTSPFREHFY